MATPLAPRAAPLTVLARTTVQWPLALLALGVLFLLVQGRIDRRDTKLLTAPLRQEDLTFGLPRGLRSPARHRPTPARVRCTVATQRVAAPQSIVLPS